MASSMYDPEHELHDLVFFNDEKDCVLLWACKARRGTRPTLYFLLMKRASSLCGVTNIHAAGRT